MRLGDALKQIVEFSWEKTIKLENHEWPFRRFGAMVPDGQSEDGTWDAYASSGPGKGNLVWELESVPIAVLQPEDVVIPLPLLEAAAKVVSLAERDNNARVRMYGKPTSLELHVALEKLASLVKQSCGER